MRAECWECLTVRGEDHGWSPVRGHGWSRVAANDAMQGRSVMSGPQLKRQVARSEPTCDGSPLPGEAADPGRGNDQPMTAERELMEAIRAYQRSSGRMFPTWSEVLGVVQSLGYEKPS